MFREVRFGAFALSAMVAAYAFTLPDGIRAQEKPAASPSRGKADAKKPEYPPHTEVLKDFEKVVSTVDDKSGLYTLWTREKDGQVYAELPKKFESHKYFFALTKSSGDTYAGLQGSSMYLYWRKYNNRLALISANVDIRSTGEDESKASVNRLFTDQVLLDVPIVTIGPGGGPVIDMDYLLVMNANVFFGPAVFDRNQKPRVYKIEKAKAFPENVELAFEFPNAEGRLQTFHCSISVIPEKSDYKPRVADERIGYFITYYNDFGKYKEDEVTVRYINRWNLRKADPKLKLSPPKKPIVFYIEHTTPIRYRRWVREGILAWNEAFEKVGLSNAIEVYYQDAATGAHMEKDPEDVRYNFVRWLNNGAGTAIGPSRVNPLTGEILDADIILTDGWIRHYRVNFEELLPKTAMEGFSLETLSWLANHPDWDPRIRLAPPAQRDYIRARLAAQAPQAYTDPTLPGDDELGGPIDRNSQVDQTCLAAEGKAFDMALMSMTFSMMNDLRAATEEGDKGADGKDEKEKKKDDEELIDGMPEAFVGPLLSNLVAHEVGHTLGLRHNFKGSSTYSLAEINSNKLAGKSSQASSVMDYNPVNIRMEAGEIQGDYTMLGVGEYDKWAIEYGYSLESDLKPILSRVAEPQLQYATDPDTRGPDPFARRYDFSADPLDYAEDQMKLAKFLRERIVEQYVKEGDSWSRARRGYSLTLSLQLRAVSMMANWIGGVHLYRDHKGDANGRPPLEVVPAEKQRKALNFVINTSFHDEVYGLTPELMQRLVSERWRDNYSGTEDAIWPIHDAVMGYQSSALTMVMNPTTLRRVYDNEFRVPAEQDALTLPELLETLRNDIWSEMDTKLDKQSTAREPMISSLRRNLQREHLKRLVDLTMPAAGTGAVYKPIANLSMEELRKIRSAAENCTKQNDEKLDPYTQAHLAEVQQVIDKAFNAEIIYNARDIGGASNRVIIIRGQEGAQPAAP